VGEYLNYNNAGSVKKLSNLKLSELNVGNLSTNFDENDFLRSAQAKTRNTSLKLGTGLEKISEAVSALKDIRKLKQAIGF